MRDFVIVMSIERPSADEWARTRAIRLAALADTPDAFGSTLAGEVDQDEAFWRRRLLRPTAVTMIATLDGRDAGLVVVAPEDEDTTVAGIFSVWVAPFARGRGVGDAIMTAAIEDARNRGFRRIVLEVGEHNAPAQALYARHGFVATGRRSHLPAPREHIPEFQMARDL